VGAVLLAAAGAQAQSEVGTVAATLGMLQIQRGGTWQDATLGAPVFVGDRLRTGGTEQAKIVLRDDSVLDLAPNTELVLETQVFDPSAHRFQSLLRLAKGKVRAWVSEYYREPRARYEVETPTAIAGVRGTEFITLYNSASEVTEIVGITEQVEVAGKLAMIGGAVQVGPQLFTQVQKGRFPTVPQRLDDARFRQYLEGLEIIGTGRRDSLHVQHPAVAGRLLSPQDLPKPAAARVSAEGLVVGRPQKFLAERLSLDVRTNTQPLGVFQSTPPGQVPTGGVKVRIF